ncbi:MAG TPA: pantoate--beta-alanine ligase [Flavobacteriales bacterium]|nr:pantoate--beta-alanine ligase [Flavobacteriales bacterium]
MRVIEAVSEIQEVLRKFKSEGKTIGFVPTMGALHSGHISLIERSIESNDITVCSIFVNPSQFNNKADLENYPRTFELDKKALGNTRCDILFYPSYSEMYPGDIKAPVVLGELASVMEGSFRKGHFDGVTTVVKRFFDIVEPDRAYFGLKDYQQYAIIKYMTDQLKLPVEIIGCETRRSDQGLALSSRNQLLDENGIRSALQFSKALKLAKSMAGKAPVEEIKKAVHSMFEQNNNCRLEYFEIADGLTLMPVKGFSGSSRIVAFIAGYVGKVRLIDNLILFP